MSNSINDPAPGRPNIILIITDQQRFDTIRPSRSL
jgi:hypothetical protein